jgi:drug/metabolite transporter (DMT)-like permease
MTETAPAAHPLRLGLLTLAALCAFAGNSLLCRAALRDTAIDAASFTGVRIAAGALTLWLLLITRDRGRSSPAKFGDWTSAAALFAYAAAFSYAYLDLAAGTGALLLFGAVQVTMISRGLMLGERFAAQQLVGFALALGGLLALLLPGASAPPLQAALLMVGAGIAWGIYSLRGRGAKDPTAVTAGNFLRALPMAAILSLLMLDSARLDAPGTVYAIASGALTSGLGYAIWYAALPHLRATTAATVQLSVPVLTALAGVVLLAEPISLRLLLCSVAVLGGVAMVVLWRGRGRQ